MINFDSPVYVSVVLYAIYALLLMAAGVTLWSALRAMHTHHSPLTTHHSPLIIMVLLAVLLGVTWLLGSTDSLTVNGHPYTDAFWLRMSDMFIYSVAALIVIAIIAVAAGRIAGRINNQA